MSIPEDPMSDSVKETDGNHAISSDVETDNYQDLQIVHVPLPIFVCKVQK